MVARCHSQYLFAFTEMMLLAIHIVAIGSLVGVTAFVAYSVGKKNGLNYAGKEQDKNVNINISSEFEKNGST